MKTLRSLPLLFLTACSTAVPPGCEQVEQTAEAFRRPVGRFSHSSDVFKSFDFTTSCTVTGTTCTRTGTAIALAATSASTFTQVGATSCIYENRGDRTPGGCWVAKGWTNQSSLFNLSTWSTLGTTTVAAAPGITCPDGSNNAYTVRNTGSGDNRLLLVTFAGTAVVGMFSGWIKANQANPPTNPLIGHAYDETGSPFYAFAAAGSSSTWSRFSQYANTAYAGGITTVATIFPSVSAPNTSPPQASGVAGAVDVCGVSVTGNTIFGPDLTMRGFADYPQINGTTGDEVISVNTPSEIVNNGDLDISVSFIPAVFDSYKTRGTGEKNSLFYAATPDGPIEVVFDGTAGPDHLDLFVRGSLIVSASDNSTLMYANSGAARTNPFTVYGSGNLPQVWTVRAWYKPASTHSAGLRVSVDYAAQPALTASTTGGALSAPTSGYLLSKLGTSQFMQGRLTNFTIYKNTASNAEPTVKGVAGGDSLVRSNERYVSMVPYIWTPLEVAAGTHGPIEILALGGDSCQGQLTLLQASTYHDNPNVGWFSMQCGVNNISGGESSSTIITAIQDWVTYVKTHNPTAKVLVGCIPPAWAYWNVHFGASAANARETIRQAVNTAIQGGGITGIDASVCGYLAALTDVDGKSLVGKYNLGTGVDPADGLHYSDEARATVLAPQYRSTLISLGF